MTKEKLSSCGKGMSSVLDSQHQHLQMTVFTLGLWGLEIGFGVACGQAHLPLKCVDSFYWATLCRSVCDLRACTRSTELHPSDHGI